MIKQKPDIPKVVVAVRANVVMSGKYLTLAREPQAKNVTDINPIIKPRLNLRSTPCIPRIIILPISTSMKPIKKFTVIRRLSNKNSRVIAASGIRAAARAAMKVEVKSCVITSNSDPRPKPEAPIKKPLNHFA